MKTARLFANGRSQAVRLPQDCRFPGSDVYVKNYEGMVILFSKKAPWSALVRSLDRFSDDFMAERAQPRHQSRKTLR